MSPYSSLPSLASRGIARPASPERLLALSGMDLDSVLALGVKPVGLTAGRGQKGAPQYLAEQAEGIPVVDAVTGPDIEKVVQAGPDVILAGQLADEQLLAQLRETALDAEGTGLIDQLTSKPAYRQLDAVREEHVTVIDGSKCGAQAAVSVLDGIRKAMVK
ncbi:hypothetical protein ACGFYA_35620 [Streptomyces sp. NPDC048305]|uniref:hypothetical protein n=1 Tax=Streptomyces sp. NPDC048305 TaxID=3365532 RepID=UPI0037246736